MPLRPFASLPKTVISLACSWMWLCIALSALAQYTWETPTNKIVLLAVNAHPDDEGIFFGGTLPYYSAVLKVPTVLLSMTSGDWNPSNLTIRENELRCAAWTYGLRYEPLFPRFRDVPSQSLNPNPYTNNIDATWDYWADGVLQGDGSDVEAGKLKAIYYVAEQIRRLRPEVIFTHDPRGEYGHHNHRATAYAVTNAFFVAADPTAGAPNLVGLPPWQATKLYLHLYGTNRLFHSFLEIPLGELADRSARQVADAGLDCHVSQGRPDVSTVYRTGENYEGYHSEWWGLYASTVGLDAVLTQALEVDGYTVPAGWSAGNFLQNLGLAPVSAPPAFTANPLVLPAAVASAAYAAPNLARWVCDPNLPWGDTLSFEKVSGPEWLVVESTGGLGGTPGIDDLGTNSWLVRVSDSTGLQADAQILVQVREQYPTVPDLVGWWKLDELEGDISHDSMLPANDGIASGSVTFSETGAAAATGSAISFDGASGKVDVAWSPELNPPLFTAALWARVLGGAGTYRSPLTSRESSPQSGYVFYAAQNNLWQLWLGATNSWKILSAGPVQTNVWIHLACSYDGVTAAFYTNGALASSMAVALRPNQHFPLRIGAGGSESAGQYWFPGTVDDVRVYGAALTAAQIAALYSNRPPAFALPISIPACFAGTPVSEATLAGKAGDPDPGDLVSYGKLDGPDWLHVEPDGRLSGMPLSAQVETWPVRLGASDMHGALATTQTELQVFPGRPPVFTSISMAPGGAARLNLAGVAGQTYLLEATTNLAAGAWQPLASNSSGTNYFEYVDPGSGATPVKFYRAIVP